MMIRSSAAALSFLAMIAPASAQQFPNWPAEEWCRGVSLQGVYNRQVCIDDYEAAKYESKLLWDKLADTRRQECLSSAEKSRHRDFLTPSWASFRSCLRKIQ